MDPRNDLLELSILYDTARGFLGLRDPGEILDVALLSLMGASGARFAAWLEPDGRALRLARAQGRDADGASLPLAAAGRKALENSAVPLTGEALDVLGKAFARTAARLELQLLVPVRKRGTLSGVFALGPKLLGEPYAGRDLPVAREIAEQAKHALGAALSGSGSWAGAPVDPRETLASLRESYPVLASIRGSGAATAALFRELVALAEFDLPVLILGETGTGKELVAQAVHRLSRRRDGDFEAINCAAIPRDLMASALFGHEKGAFTGADSTVRGAFERAGDGTIFLDEIGDMPLDTQAMLLRVLEERGFRRVGGTTLIPARARVISATNRDLLREVEEGRFRRDLFYRLQMYTVRIAPLRERPEEIGEIARHVLAGYCPRRDRLEISPAFVDALTHRELRGNVRELESLVAGAIVQSNGAKTLGPEHLPSDASPMSRTIRGLTAPGDRGGDPVPSWENVEREYIVSVLRLTEGNRREAARLMNIPRTTLNSRMKKFEIEYPG